jgi:hypothetical protein
MIDTLKTVLTTCHWTSTDILAYGQMVYPFGVPVVDGGTATPKRVAGCGYFANIGAQVYSLYDPGREIPDPNSPCAFAGMGTSAYSTLVNLAAVMTLSSPFTVTASASPLGLDLIAKVGGAQYNGMSLNTDGRWGFTSTGIQGGGFQFDTTESGASDYNVKVRSYPGYYSPIVRFDFTFVSGTSQFDLASGTPPPPDSGSVLAAYTIIGNPHSFVFFNGENRQSYILACAPLIMSGGVSSSNFIVGSQQFVYHTYANSQRLTAINGTQYTGGASNYVKMLQFRTQGEHTLLSPNGKPIYTTAYVSYGNSVYDEGGIIGVLYDCVLCSDMIASGDPTALAAVMIAGVKFVAIAQSSGSSGETRGTLLMAIPKSDTVVPKTGTGNMFGAGVTRLSGDSFTADMVGKIMTMNGQSGTIESVTDGDHLTLTQPISIIAGGTWTIA